MDKSVLAVIAGKAVGFFFYMIFEHHMGGTKFKSVLGLVLSGFFSMLEKFKKPKQ